MKSLSKDTEELIRKVKADLAGGRHFFNTRMGVQASPLSAFDKITSSGEALAIPPLTGFLLNRQSNVREAAARTIGQLLAMTTPAEFPQLDEACRHYWTCEAGASFDWPHLKPTGVKQLVRLPAAVAVVGVASFHGSGFIREAAVKELATVSDGSELPFLLLRLNDWVGVVRESSANAVQQRIRPEYASHFLRNLRLVFRLRSCGRGQDEEMIVQVTALLEDPSAFSILREGVFSHDRWLRRTALQMALAVKSEPGTALLQEILCHSDPIMRLWAARIVLERLGETELGPVLSALARDGFPPVRCEALTLYMRHFPNSASAKLNLALLDGSPAVRSLARYWVKTQNPEFNFADFYLKSLQAPSTRLVTSAILGLGETGKAADATGVLPFLEARLPGIRIAAIHSLAALDGDRLVARFVAALTSENPGVSNAVTRALLNRTNLIMDQLLLLFRGSLPSHVRKNIFRLMMNLPFWARGVYLFETLRDRDEHIVELGLRALKSWLEKSRNMATPPSHLELGELACGLKASAGMLSSHDLSEFEFLLRTYR